MLRKPFHGWRVKQEIQKLTAICTPSPRQSPGSPTRPTPLPLSFSTARTSHPRLTFVFPSKPPHFLSLQARCATYYSRVPNPKLEVSPAREFHVADEEAMKSGGKVIEGHRPEQEMQHNILFEQLRPLANHLASKLEVSTGREFHVADGEEHDYRPKKIIRLTKMSLWKRTKLKASRLVYEVTSQDEVDRFYQEMSKEVETLLHERDQRTLPEELSRRVVVTCVTDGGACDVFMLRTKQRSQVRVVKESCREIEVESVTTYVLPQAISVQYPRNPLELLRLKRNYKVVNKLEVSPGQGTHVEFEEAMKYGGKPKVTLLRTWVIQPWEKIMIIVASLLLLKEMDIREVPSKEPTISTVRMLSALCVAVPGVAILSGIYFGWKICWITFGN